MRSPLERVEEHVILDTVTSAWGLQIDELRYFPEGGGAYHWIAHCNGAPRWFVTTDDLDTKPWLGDDRDTVFDGLCTAYRTAMDLRAAGAAFVVAPLAARSGAPAERIDDRHSVSLFEHVDGEPGSWGRPWRGDTLGDVVKMLAVLHGATSNVDTVVRREVQVPARGELEDALDSLRRPWDGGPLSDDARAELTAHQDAVRGWLAELDRLAAVLARDDAATVVTHGEPHPGNLIRTSTGVVLVDWDTVARARPERDLWMLVDAADDTAGAYEALTGTTLDSGAVTAYRLLWMLADVASFVVQLRGEHAATTDARRALIALRDIFSGREPAPYGRRNGSAR